MCYYIVNNKPLLEDLQQYVTPHYAANWKVIGENLGLPNGRLFHIVNYSDPCDDMSFCNKMWEAWLRLEDPNITWMNLLTVLDSLPNQGD